MKMTLLIALGLLVLVPVLWVRLAPSDPARWHVDPATAPDPATPNFARREAVIALPPDSLAARLDALAEAEGAVRLAGDARHATFVTRTRLMRYPDYISIRLEPAPEGTRVTAFSRARFGHGDMGVNRARLKRWFAALEG
ncbi:MAG: DUF1499 domain-containing protein [Pararhodobacter sp.]